jgi:hypothetical protein
MPRGRHPPLRARDVVVVEPEAPADRLTVGQIEDLRGRDARVRELEQPRHDAEHRVRLAQGPVRQAQAQVGTVSHVDVIGTVVRQLLEHLTRAERRVDQRRVGLDVGAHDDDVSRLERRVVGQGVQERVAQDLDLAGAAVAGVDGQGRVVRVERRAVAGVLRGRGVDPDVGLEAGEQRPRLRERAVVELVGGRGGRGSENDLELAGVLAPGREEAVAGHGDGGVAATTRRPHGIAERRGELLPGGGRRMQEVQVDVAMRGDGGDRLQPGRRQARQAQHREAVREVREPGLVLEAPAGDREALGRARYREVRTEPTPQLRLPAGVLGQAGVVSGGPPLEHPGPVQRVAVEEICDVPYRAEPAT